MTIKTREELEKLSVEELRAYHKELKDHEEKQKLLKEVSAIEVDDSIPSKLSALRDEAKKGNKSPELIEELSKIKGEVEQLKKASNPTFGKEKFEKGIEKDFGSDGKEALSVAKDLAQCLPTLDGVASMCGKKVTELKAFKEFIGVDDTMFIKALKVIEKQNRMNALRTKTGLDTSDSSEWVPTGMEATVMDQILKAKGVAANIPSFDMPSSPYDWPVNGGNNTTYYVTQSVTGGNITVSGTNISAAKTTFAAAKIANRQDLSEEMNEDAAFAIFPAVQRMMIDSLNDGFERCVLFGDESGTTTNLNYDGGSVTATAGAADVFLAIDGIVHKALIDSNGSKQDVNAASGVSDAVRLVMAKMGEGAKDTNALRLFVPPSVYFAALADDALKLVQNYGNGAAILSGEVGRIYGIPVIMSSGIPLTRSDGKVDGVTAGLNILGSFLLVNTNYVMVGWKRRVKVASDYFNITDHYSVVSSMRFDVQQFGANQANKNPIGYGYNFPV